MKKLFFLIILIVSSAYLGALPTLAETDEGFLDRALRNASDTQQETIETNPFNEQLARDISGTGTPLSTNPIESVNQIIRVLLSFMGIGTIALMLYAGFRWMTAAGNDDAVSDAKKTLRNAVIGLILIMSAYGLTIFVARRIQRESGSFGVGGGRFSGSATINTSGGQASGSFGPFSGSVSQ